VTFLNVSCSDFLEHPCIVELVSLLVLIVRHLHILSCTSTSHVLVNSDVLASAAYNILDKGG
jgi:hypothetical protein